MKIPMKDVLFLRLWYLPGERENKNEKLYDKTLDLLLCWVHIKKAQECKPWGPTDKHSRRLDDGRGNRL